MISSMIRLNKRKEIYESKLIFVDALNWGEIDNRSSTGSIVISIDFLLLSLPW